MLWRYSAPPLSAFVGRQPVYPAATSSFAAVQQRPLAAAAQPQRPMGFSWPFAAARKKSSDSSRLQHLLDVSTAFSREPSAKSLQAMKAALAAVPLVELGSDSETPPLGRDGVLAAVGSGFTRCKHPISYQHIFEDRNVSMGIFAMHAGAALPLHDHPGMHVMSRVLFGRMHVLSYDWADRQQHTACLALDSEVEAGDTTVLGPDFGGNMHCLTAITDVAIFDVLAPSYDPKGGRNCTYFCCEGTNTGNAAVILKECEPPAGFNVVTVPYRGIRPRV